MPDEPRTHPIDSGQWCRIQIYLREEGENKTMEEVLEDIKEMPRMARINEGHVQEVMKLIGMKIVLRKLTAVLPGLTAASPRTPQDTQSPHAPSL